MGDKTIKLAVVHGLAHAKELLKQIDAGEAYYDLVEVMTCPGGCVGGAGQPHGLMPAKKERAQASTPSTAPPPSSAPSATLW